MKFFFLGLLVLFVLNSCTHTTDKNGALIINFEEKKSPELSELLDVNFIRLQTDPDCRIGKTIVQLEQYDDKLFILSGGGGNKLLVFDLMGNFISCIGERASGTGSYLIPVSFTIDPINHMISLIDVAQKKMLNYDADTFEFISEVILRYDSFSFEYLDNETVVWKDSSYDSMQEDWTFLVADRSQKLKKHYVNKVYKNAYFTGPSKTMYRMGNDLYGYTQYDPVVYRLDTDTVLPVYHLQFGKDKLPPVEYLNQFDPQFYGFVPTLNSSDYIAFYSVQETADFMSVYYEIQKNAFIGMYHKRSKKTYTYSKEQFEEQLGIAGMSTPCGKVDGYVVAPLPGSADHPVLLLFKWRDSDVYLPV